MRIAAKIILLPILFLLVSKANAQVEWNEPEVVPEKLTRANRRVMRFSGVTKPNTKIRIRKGKLKLFLNNGKTRWAKIPQKNRVQFPVVADRDGSFTFDLYLPTVAVEIPVQLKTSRKRKWKTYKLNFRVPDSGEANDFIATTDSFRASDETVERLDKDANYYNSKMDQGQTIGERDGSEIRKESNIRAWGGLGLSYFSIDSPSGTPGVSGSGSTIVIPTFRFGGDYDFSNKWRFRAAVRSTSGSVDGIGGVGTQGTDFSWLEAQVGAVRFIDNFISKKGHLGLDFGIQLQALPIFRTRLASGGSVFSGNTTFFDNNTYNLYVGLTYERRDYRVWNWEAYFRYIYPLTAGDAFSIESTFPINFEMGGGITRGLTDTLDLGVYGQLNYFSFEAAYSDSTQTISTDLALMLFTVDVRLIAHF